jgi:thioredoxin-related protein
MICMLNTHTSQMIFSTKKHETRFLSKTHRRCRSTRTQCASRQGGQEAEQTVAARYGIRSIPTLILFLKGREVARQSGAMPTTAIVAWARQALSA